MKNKRYKKRKSISTISAFLFFVVLAVTAFLITFGGLYMRDHFKQLESLRATAHLTQLVVKDDEIIVKESGNEQEEVLAPRMCVILDAGHGGNDGGTYYNDVIEKDINLAVTLCLKNILEQKDVEVILTRSTDEYFGLDERVMMANQTSADLFVSIHCNYYEDSTSVRGIDCYYVPGCKDGKLCAEKIVNSLKAADIYKVRGAKAEEFYVTEHTTMTALLVEVGFLSNATDRNNLMNAEYQENIALDMSKGILAYFEEKGVVNN